MSQDSLAAWVGGVQRNRSQPPVCDGIFTRQQWLLLGLQAPGDVLPSLSSAIHGWPDGTSLVEPLFLV